MLHGQCHCGAISYEMDTSDVKYSAICHCGDCRRQSGGPMVSWSLVPREAVTIIGEPVAYASSELAHRHFCGKCGTSLFYTNDTVFPGMIDVQTATLDDPDALAPAIQVQTAERLAWVEKLPEMPGFERYPG